MDKTDSATTVAKDATGWQKKKAHEGIMAKLSTVNGFYSMEEDYDLYPVRQWNSTELTEEELKEIMQRGITTEIACMIHRYGMLAQTRGHGPVLPVAIQIMLVKRNNPEEIKLYTSYQGFCEEAQDIIMNSWPHEQVMSYLSQHGLSLNQQRKLLVFGSKDEIIMQIRHHGLHDEIIVSMFTQLKETNSYEFFYQFIQNHELPIAGQRQMLEIVNSKAFSNYISCYGLWEDVHPDMFKHRSAADIILYFERHHYVSPKGEDAMVRWPNEEERHRLIMTYIRCWKNTAFSPEDHFLSALLQAPELDYEAISKVLISMPYSSSFLYESAAQDIDLMATGTKEAILARFETAEPLHIRALTELFFRNEPTWFEAYIKKCTEKCCYRY